MYLLYFKIWIARTLEISFVPSLFHKNPLDNSNIHELRLSGVYVYKVFVV